MTALLLGCVLIGCAPRVSFVPAQTRFDFSPPHQTLPIGLFGDCPWIDGPDGAMLIDTGAVAYVIADNVARERRFPQIASGRTHVDAHGASGRSLGVVQIDALHLGRVELRDFAAYVLHGGQLPMLDRRPLSVLGRAALVDCRITIDYPALSLTLEPASKQPIAPDAIPLSAGDPPRVRATVGGRNLLLGLDTGCSRGITLPWSMRTKLPLEKPAVQTFISRSAFGMQPIWAARLDGDVLLAGHRVHHPIVSFIPRDESPVIGGELLRHFIVTIDQRVPQVLFRRPADASEPIEMPSVCDYGLSITWAADGRGIAVTAVTPGTDAAAAGMVAGDRLLSVEGTPVERFDDWPRLIAYPDSPPLHVTVGHGTERPREVTLRPTVLVP